MRAASRTVLVRGPAWSSCQDIIMTPALLTRPYVGLSPTQPQRAAGMRMLPPVSVPIVAQARSATVAAPLPPLEPPGMRSRSQGLRVGPYQWLLVVVP